jgi:hypothetical protein
MPDQITNVFNQEDAWPDQSDIFWHRGQNAIVAVQAVVETVP